MLKIQCKSCGVELESHPTKTKCCGCSNMTSIRNEVISANDLSYVLLLQGNDKKSRTSILSNEDLAYQEQRKQRKVRKLTYEER